MDTAIPPVKTIAPVRNVAAFSGLADRLMNRSPDLPGMAAFYGNSGAGKTFGSLYAANRIRAYCVEAKSVWTRKHTCKMILAELGVIKAEGSIPEMVDQIGRELALSGRPLIIDDAQLLFVNAATARMIRDIYKSSAGSPIILIGELDLLPQLKKIENIGSLMLDEVAALPANLADTKHLSKLYCPGVAVSDDVLTRLITVVAGSIRRVCTRLDALREHATVHGLREIGMGSLPEGFFPAGGR